MRYVPDYLRNFSAKSSNPHDHKQIMTAEGLDHQLAQVLSRDEWDWEVIKAWPWALIDLAQGNRFIHYFKIHAVAWQVSKFNRDMRQHVIEFCREHSPRIVYPVSVK